MNHLSERKLKLSFGYVVANHNSNLKRKILRALIKYEICFPYIYKYLFVPIPVYLCLYLYI